ncbi:MAG: hypothetical protein ACRD12_09655 [Acidimicrobiales bacterium]
MIVLVIVAVLAVVAIVGWFGLRRHGESATANPGWQRTDEVFRDPSTGRVMRVWVDPADDNTRHYVPEPPT